jgi:hypothetical protein
MYDSDEEIQHMADINKKHLMRDCAIPILTAFCNGNKQKAIDIISQEKNFKNNPSWYRILFGAITVESSVVDQFAKILDKKSMVVGSDVRVHYNGGVMTNRQLLAENKGREVKKHGRL